MQFILWLSEVASNPCRDSGGCFLLEKNWMRVCRGNGGETPEQSAPGGYRETPDFQGFFMRWHCRA
jgi:hypothetical protein